MAANITPNRDGPAGTLAAMLASSPSRNPVRDAAIVSAHDRLDGHDAALADHADRLATLEGARGDDTDPGHGGNTTGASGNGDDGE